MDGIPIDGTTKEAVPTDRPLTKKERRRREREGKRLEWLKKQREKQDNDTVQEQGLSTLPRKSSLLDKMRQRLAGGQFRMVNERLYTTSGDEGLELFTDQPELFYQYHEV